MSVVSLTRRINRLVFDLPLTQHYGRYAYSKARARQTPAQSTTTKFFRNLDQLATFEGPLRELLARSSIRVLVAGCSEGCEAFTIAAFLAERFPKLDWRIEASDISDDALRVARNGVYGREHGLGGRLSASTALLERRLFERQGDRWRVRDEIRARVTFARRDVLAASFAQSTDYDLVFGQNFMIHMTAEDEAKAFGGLVAAARSGGALFVGGMDLDRRPGLVRAHRLSAVNWNLRAIHNADTMRRSAWPWHYWTLEPIDRRARHFNERYATIFVKGEKT